MIGTIHVVTEDFQLQLTYDIITLVYILIPLVIGTASGYVIGGQTNFSAVNRFVYSAVLSLIGGILVGLLIAGFILPNQYSFLLSVLSFAGGSALGMTVNWAPTPDKPAKRYVVFDPEEDDEEFDRQIEDAFKSSDY